MAKEGQLIRLGADAPEPGDEAGLAALLDPVALEERLKEARARRTEALAQRRSAETDPPQPASVRSIVAAPAPTPVIAPPRAAAAPARRVPLLGLIFAAGLLFGGILVGFVTQPELRSRVALLIAPEIAATPAVPPPAVQVPAALAPAAQRPMLLPRRPRPKPMRRRRRCRCGRCRWRRSPRLRHRTRPAHRPTRRTCRSPTRRPRRLRRPKAPRRGRRSRPPSRRRSMRPRRRFPSRRRTRLRRAPWRWPRRRCRRRTASRRRRPPTRCRRPRFRPASSSTFPDRPSSRRSPRPTPCAPRAPPTSRSSRCASRSAAATSATITPPTATAPRGCPRWSAPELTAGEPATRDFTDYTPPPLPGRVEVWLAGEPGRAAARRPAPPAPDRLDAPDPAPDPAPPPYSAPAPAPVPALPPGTSADQAEAVARIIVQRSLDRLLQERPAR